MMIESLQPFYKVTQSNLYLAKRHLNRYYSTYKKKFCKLKVFRKLLPLCVRKQCEALHLQSDRTAYFL
jgi:hypothetical protein